MSEDAAVKHSKKPKIQIKQHLKKPIVKIVLILIVIVLYSYALFFLGQKNGIAKQKELDAKNPRSSLSQARNGLPSSSNRKTFMGTVSSVDDKSIEITPRNGEKTKVAINDETRITGSDAKKTDIKALKKDQKVIVSTTKDKDGKYTATRIRIQK